MRDQHMQSNNKPKDANSIQTVTAAIKAGIWDGVTDNETSQTIFIKTLVALSIGLVTPFPPFFVATIPLVGLKRVGQGSYHLGSSLFTLFKNYRENKSTETSKAALTNGSFNNH